MIVHLTTFPSPFPLYEKGYVISQDREIDFTTASNGWLKIYTVRDENLRTGKKWRVVLILNFLGVYFITYPSANWKYNSKNAVIFLVMKWTH